MWLVSEEASDKHKRLLPLPIICVIQLSLEWLGVSQAKELEFVTPSALGEVREGVHRLLG